MATKRDMVITIGKDGNVKIQVEGVAGKECLDFSKFLEDELGEVTDRVHTGEYYQQEEGVQIEVSEHVHTNEYFEEEEDGDPQGGGNG